MPARSNKSTQRASGRSLTQDRSNAGLNSGGKVTSTVSNIEFVAPSTKSNVPGISRADLKPKPPGSLKRNNNAMVARPLPGAKLRPLQTNESYVNDRYYNNTWSSTPHQASSSVSTNVKAKPSARKPDTKISAGKNASPTKPPVSPPIKTPDVPQHGRDSSHSISSIYKEVLPEIPKSEPVEKIEEPVPVENKTENGTPVIVQPPVEPQLERAPSARPQPQGSHLKPSKAERLEGQAEKVAAALDKDSIYKPEWYLSHKIRPTTIKSGRILLCIGQDTYRAVREDIDNTDASPLFLKDEQPRPNAEILPLTSMCSIERAEDVLNRFVNSTSLIMVTMNKNWEQNSAPEDSVEPYYPAFLTRELAQKFNQQAGREEYYEVDCQDDLWRLKNTEIYRKPLEKVPDIEELEKGGETLRKLCTDLKLPFVNSYAEVRKLVDRNNNKRLNTFKQEQAIHPDVYLQPIENEESYNHLYMSYRMCDEALPRPQLLDNLVSAVTADFSKSSSPIVVTGGKKSGKTVLCSLLTTANLQQDANVITRYCATTTLSQTLADVLIGISKQMHAIYKTSLISPSYTGVDSNLVLEAFIKTLTEVNESPLNTPLVIVLDGVDKVVDKSTACQLVQKCCGVIPPGMSIIVSFRDNSMHGQFFHFDVPTIQNDDEQMNKDLISVVSDDTKPSDKDSIMEAATSLVTTFSEFVAVFKTLQKEGCDIGKTEALFTELEEFQKKFEEFDERGTSSDFPEFNRTIKKRRARLFAILENWNRIKTRESVNNLTELAGMDETAVDGNKAPALAKKKRELIEDIAKMEASVNTEVKEFSIAMSSMRTLEQQLNDRMKEAMEAIEEREKVIEQRKGDIIHCPDESVVIVVPDFTEDEIQALVKQLSTGLHSKAVFAALERTVVKVFKNPLLARVFCNWFNYDNVIPIEDRVKFLENVPTEMENVLSHFNEKFKIIKGSDSNAFKDIPDSPFAGESSAHMFLIKILTRNFDEHDGNVEDRETNPANQYFSLMKGFADSYENHFLVAMMTKNMFDLPEDQRFTTWYKRILLKGCSLNPQFMGSQQVDSDGTLSTLLRMTSTMEADPAIFRFLNTESTIQEQLTADMRKFVECFKEGAKDNVTAEKLENFYSSISDFYCSKYLVVFENRDPSLLEGNLVEEMKPLLGPQISVSVILAINVIGLIVEDYEERLENRRKSIQIKTEEHLSAGDDDDDEDDAGYDLFDDLLSDDEDGDDYNESIPNDDRAAEIEAAEKEAAEKEAAEKEAAEKEAAEKEAAKKEAAEKEAAKNKAVKESEKEEKNDVKEFKPKTFPVWLELLMLQHSSSIYIALKIFNVTNKAQCDPSRFLFSYDLITQVLQAYGVDYLDYLTTKALKEWKTISKVGPSMHIDVGPLEMFHHFLSCNLEDLRTTPNSFPKLFMSCFSRDFKLGNEALKKLYNRVEAEIAKSNQPHFITQIVSPCNDPLLSTATKHWMSRVSDRFAAAECISNAAYILSHNRLNEIKLWELTGDFIACHTLVGKIVAVCPLRQHRCFMAVTEEISDVGTRSAKVWYIDRQRSKCVLDLGQRFVHAAWFDPTGSELVIVEQEPNKPDCISIVLISPTTLSAYINLHKILTFEQCQPSNFIAELSSLPHKIDEDVFNGLMVLLKADKKSTDYEDLEKYYKHHGDMKEGQKVYDLDLENIKKNKFSYTNLESTWIDYLIRSEVMDELCMPMYQLRSESFQVKEKLHKMQKIKLQGMTSNGEIVLDCQLSTSQHQIIFFKYTRADASSERPATINKIRELEMNASATMTLMPSDDFVYCDSSTNTGLTSWHLPSDSKKMFGNEQNENVTCLQFEVEESQILSFTKGKVTSWSANTKTTESCFALEKQTEVIAACLQDNWLLYANRKGEMTFRYDMRKKKSIYTFKSPVDWIDSHVIDEYVYAACHILTATPSICFLRYKVPNNL